MISKKTIALVTILILLLVGLFFSIFKSEEVSDSNWTVDYRYESKEPHGAWVLSEVLKEAYGEDRLVKLNSKNYIPHHQNDSRKGYFIIGDYLSLEKRKVDNLSEFVLQGNDAIIISGSRGYYLDTLFSEYLSYNYIKDSIIYLSNHNNDQSYELSYFYKNLNTASSTSFSTLDSLEINSEVRIDTLSLLNDTLPIFIKIPYGDGSFYIHTIPDAFDNIAFKQEKMRLYATSALPLLDVDTLFLDHNLYNQNWKSDESPLQFIMSQPPLKWAYYITLLGLILFVLSRGKRKQKVIPPLQLNENTSVEYIHTLSELYRSQNQHHKLVKHLKTIFTQWIKKKYFLTPDDPQYISKIAHKSKISEDEIRRLKNRLDAAINNRRFGAEQLENLHKELNQFYKNCK